MPFFPNANEVPSARRPPQLNETVCSCRCGCGCQHEVEPAGAPQTTEDGASTHSYDTLVESNCSEADETSPPSPNGPEQQVDEDTVGVRGLLPGWDHDLLEIRTRFGGFWNDAAGFRLSRTAIGLEADDGPDSMKNEPLDSDDHSTVTSRISVRCMSPGPGIGAWTKVDGFHEHYFLASPLRLTPQRRYCRGLVASHLIAHDDSVSTDGDQIVMGAGFR